MDSSFHFIYFKINAFHPGPIQFRICNVTNPSVDPTMDCFDRNPLRFENGATSMPMIFRTMNDAGENVYRVQLPGNLVCNHCLLQVRRRMLLIEFKDF